MLNMYFKLIRFFLAYTELGIELEQHPHKTYTQPLCYFWVTIYIFSLIFDETEIQRKRETLEHRLALTV